MAKSTKGTPNAKNGPSLVPGLPNPKQSPASTPAGGVTHDAGAPLPKLANVSKLSAVEIDRLGVVTAVVTDYKLQVAPFEREKAVLENRVNAAVSHLAAEEIFPAEGERYRLNVGMQAEQQQLVDGGLAKVLDFLGQEKFLSICGVTFTALEKHLTAEQYSDVVVKSRTGRRTISVVAKAAPPLQPAA